MPASVKPDEFLPPGVTVEPRGSGRVVTKGEISVSWQPAAGAGPAEAAADLRRVVEWVAAR